MTDIESSEPALVPITSRAPVRADSPTFAELGVRAETVEALAKAGITRAFAIQEYALPIAMRGTDLIGQAPTGTGKTLGFGLPMLERLLAPSEGADGVPQALVVVPTRELGLQVARDIAAAGATRGVRVLPIYGGVAYEPQVDALKKGVEILVGTPGRLLDLAKQKQLKLSGIKTLVLDEADRMLDLGFLDDVEKILAMLPAQRQTMLFSATMPDPIVALSRRFLHHPVTIHAGHTAESAASPLTKQVVYRTHPLNKVEMIARILQARGRGLTMIFTRTKRAADRLAEDLDFRGFAVAAVHGDLGQGARERALRAFRSGKIDVLVATDVAARGLDVSGVTHVINYDCPEDPETYTHRIGRTGRAGATGVAVTFVDWEDMPRWVLIDKTLGLSMPQPPETYHTSAALYSDLDIPTDISGTLPTADRSRVGLAAEIEEDLGGTGRRRERGKPRRGGRPEGPSSFAPSSDSGNNNNNNNNEDRPKRQRRRRRTGDELSGTPSDTPSGTSESPAESSAAAVEDAPAPRTRSRRRAVTEPASLESASAESPVLESPVLESPVLESPSESTVAAPAPARARSRRRVAEPESADSTPFSSAPDLSAPAESDLASDLGTAPARSRRRAAAPASGDGEPASDTAADTSDSAPRTRSRRRTAPAIASLFSDGSADVAGGSSTAAPASSDAAASDAVPSDAVLSDAVLSDAVPSDAVPSEAAASDGDFDDAGDDADRPRRRRRRGARGNRGSGAGSAEMTGGSEAGVGTTADA